MSPQIRAAILGWYFEPVTAFEASLRVSMSVGITVSSSRIRQIWDEAYEANIVMRELGERPANGFEESDELTLARTLMRVAA